MQEIGKFNKNINVIPSNMEKYMAFMISDLVFIDSFQFMSSSLSNVANNLPKDGFHYIKKEFGSAIHDLMTKKGVHPYDYMDSFDWFEEMELPPKNKFYSKLTDEYISDSDYEHAKTVWKTV